MTDNELAAEAALRALQDLIAERALALNEGRPLKALAQRIRWAKAEFRRRARIAGVAVTL